MQRRRFAQAAGAMLVVGLAATSTAQRAAVNARRITLIASKFAYSTAEIHARRGESVTLVIASTDFTHGFSLPELNARIDVPPGKTAELSLHNLPAGRYTYLCDNFCGEGHDKMTGMLIVADA
jgi:cytochrome c oxidase subunit 2